jgi:hypothetical protein
MTEDGGAARAVDPGGRAGAARRGRGEGRALLRELVGPRADDLLTLLDRFEAHHPTTRRTTT